ncbi:MAG TPA: cation diffusion facilitator family transporter [Candidatus Corynebacterium avicola]|uniref:Cation diffusion facilitator family transporter n=1 Tax=Candidatus Corynebacterium avicola TaxID=2838527 RepID=A0A9D1RLW4_9CORY|nr:cation diffusion facilitator family transporter [Candidatus Corynebacterium avicola]
METRGVTRAMSQGHGHSHDHDHSHNHSHGQGVRGKALWFVIAMTLTIFLAQVIGGIVSGSLALLADAGHMLSDAGGLIVAAFAMLIGSRPATTRATYGFRRAEVMAALVNAGAVAVIGVWIAVAAFRRLGEGPEEIQTGLMLVVAVVGLLANVASAVILHRSAGESLNMRGAYLHVLVDLLGSVAVIFAAVVIQFTDWFWVDAVASLIIAAMILPRAWSLMREAGGVLMEQVPGTVDAMGVRDAILDAHGVEAVHDLHMWSVDGESTMATVHVVTSDREGRVLDDVQRVFTDAGISHSTVQLEAPEHRGHEHMDCDSPLTGEFVEAGEGQ